MIAFESFFTTLILVCFFLGLHAQTQEFMSISGYCTEIISNKPLICEVEMESSEGIFYNTVCDSNGYYSFDSIQNNDQLFRINLSCENFYSEKVKIKCSRDTVIHMELHPIDCCFDPFPVIYFDFKSRKIKDEYKSDIKSMAKLLIENPNIGIEVIGFVDTLENKNMAEKRAKKVRRELIKKGVPKKQIIITASTEITTTYVFDVELNKYVEIPLTKSYIETQPPDIQNEIYQLFRRVMFNFYSDEIDKPKTI